MNEFISVVFLGIFLRWSVSLYPYSGAGKPPMYGDYEAQRHWQEITVNLPIKDWYSNSSSNDLLYWGLDYPPLTAYHSFLCGLIAKLINTDYIALHTSRGYESYDHKLFMRYTVLAMDLLLYFPAVFYFAKTIEKLYKTNSGMLSCFKALILYPGLYLIDYGHFQYNNVSLGLFIIAVGCMFQNLDYVGSMFFSLALNYKQMALYHSLPFFFYLLGKCLKEKTYFLCLKKLTIIGVIVICTFLCCWLPFLSNSEMALQVLYRIFPFDRGLFEDKVASFWCSVSVIFKLKSMFHIADMAKICLVVTLIFILPSGLHLIIYPKPTVLKYSLINISFIFFLFSFHVHEKSILLVTTSASFVFYEEPFVVTWFFIISIISMLPLLVKDGLFIPTLSLVFLPYILYHHSTQEETNKFSISRTSFSRYLFLVSLIGLTVLSLASFTLPAPLRYPDLFPVLISLYSCMHYCLFCIYFHYCQFTVVNFDNLRYRYQKIN